MKMLIQHLANALGYEVHSLRTSMSPSDRRVMIMKNLGINHVLDVGANAGQYAIDLRKSGFKGTIWSYEPLKDAFAALTKASANDPAWKAINSACGRETGKSVINVAKNSWSSSLLPILKTHLINAAESRYIAKEEISVCSLEDSLAPTLTATDNLWLKIDAQGFEAEVINGAGNSLARVVGIECELSTVPLYQGQPLIAEMMTLLYEKGFRLIHIAPIFNENATGYTLQMDGIFLKA